MSICPICNSELEDDFGVTTCTSCGTSLIIDMDGNAKSSAPVEAAIEVAPQVESVEEDVSETVNQIEESLYQDQEFEEPQEHEAPVAEVVAEVEDQDWEAEPMEQPEGAPSEPLSAAEAFADVAAFANPTASMDAGRFAYNLKISGIDTIELSQAVRGVVSEEKMRWDADGIMGSMNNGVVLLENINPVKACKVIQDLFDYDLEMEWEQNEIHSN